MKIFLVDFFVDGHHVEYAAHLGRYLLQEGHEVVFLVGQADESLKMAVDIGLDVRYVADRDRSLPSQTFRMIPRFRGMLRHCFKVAAEEHADLVHLLYLDRAMLLPLWWHSWCSEIQVPVFGTLWWPYHFLDGPHLSPAKKLYGRVVRKTLKSLLVRDQLAVLFVHTERIKDAVLDTLGTGRLADRFVVVPDPVYVPDPGASKQACRRRLGLPQERLVLLFFGQLRGAKGPDLLLEAANYLPPEVLVVFAGAAMNSSSLNWEQEVRTRRLDGRVRLDLGRVPDELVPVYFQAADAVVLPYRRSFLGTSGVLGRAAGAQKPVIATDVGEVGDLVRRHGLGLVLEPEDPLRLAAVIKQYTRERSALDVSVAKHASLYSSQNHWRQMGASVLKAYQRTVSRSHPLSRSRVQKQASLQTEL